MLSGFISAEKSLDIAKKLLSPKAGKSSLVVEVPDNSRHDFYQRFQRMGNQRQIAHVSNEDASKLVVVNEAYDDVLGSPTTASAARNTLRRLRSRTLPENIGSSPEKSFKDIKFDDEAIEKMRTSSSSEFASPTAARARRAKRMSIKPDVIGTASEAILSPRSKYIEVCMREGINPRAALVLKRKTNKELLLAHQGMGDKMAMLFAESVVGMTYVELIDLTDNNLTDAGMSGVIKLIFTLQSLSTAILSDNVFGTEAALALCEYFEMKNCNLQRLVLHHCEVDDSALQSLVACLVRTGGAHLIDIDLSNNKIGGSEGIGAVNSSGDILAQWLSRSDCLLARLNLSWNMLRMDSAASLVRSLAFNQSLVFLDLSYNGLGKEGGLALGAALVRNNVLKHLIVAHNNLEAMATLTICAGVIDNKCLQEIVFDGNPIGEKGASAMMMIPVIRAGTVKVSAKQCNLTMKDQSCWFNFDSFTGRVILRMDDPYERAVSLLLLRLVAAHHSIVFAKVEYDPTGKFQQSAAKNEISPWVGALGKNNVGKNSTKQSQVNAVVGVELVPHRISREATLDDRQLIVAERMRQMIAASSDVSQAIKLFEEADLDHSGGIDINELSKLMMSLSIKLSDNRLRETMSKYDTEGNGYIEISDFLKMLKQINTELSSHLDDLLSIPVMVLKEELDKDATSATQYVPPLTGGLMMEVVDGFIAKDIYRTLASCDRHYIDNVANTTTDADMMQHMSLKLTKIHFDDAVNICKHSMRTHKTGTQVLSMLLRSMSTVAHAREILSSVLGRDRAEMQRFRRDIGQYLKPMLGMPNAYYSLDMSLEADRSCLMSLFGLSEAVNHQRALKSPFGYGFTGDTSQKGNWSAFRNEVYNGKPFVLNAEFLSNLPTAGRIEFDFSGEVRPGPEVVVIKDGYLVKILAELGLIKNDDATKAETLKELLHVKHVSNHTLKGDGRVVYECPLEDTLDMDNHHAAFYDNLGSRAEAFAQASKLEDLIITAAVPEKGMSAMKKPKPAAAKVVSLGGMELKLDGKQETVSNATPRNPVLVTPIKVPNSVLKKKQMETPLPAIADELPSTLIPLTGLLHGTPLKNVSSKSEKSDKVADGNALILSTPLKKSQSVDKGDPVPVESSGKEASLSGKGGTIIPVDPTTVAMIKPGMLNTELELPAHPAWLDSDDGDDQSTESDSSSDDDTSDSDFEHNTKGQIKYNVFNKCSAETIEYLRSIFANENASPQAKLKRLLDAIEETVAAVHWMMARHVALILTCMEKLPFGLTEKTKYFGNYRVEVVVLLFGHIVDLHNFELVLRVLKPYEIACVIARIGWLNFINPMKPEGAYGLDLTKWDQRMVAKILIVLETHEPGENWAKKRFRWTLDSPEIPGWILTQPWLTEEGLPNRGILDVSYFSGEGARKNGCVALPKFRKSLLYLTLMEEREMVEEEHRGHHGLSLGTPSGTHADGHGHVDMFDVGLKAIKLETDLWYNYLIHDMNSENSTIDAVTAVRKAKKTPGVNAVSSATGPVFRDRGEGLASISEGAVSGGRTTPIPPGENLTSAHFIAKLNEAKTGDGSAKGFVPLIQKESLGPLTDIRKEMNENTTPMKAKPFRNRSVAVSGAVSGSSDTSSTAVAEVKPYRNRSYAGNTAGAVTTKPVPGRHGSVLAALPEVQVHHKPSTSILDSLQEVRATILMMENPPIGLSSPGTTATATGGNSNPSSAAQSIKSSGLSVNIPEKLSDVILPGASHAAIAKPFRNRSVAVTHVGPVMTSASNNAKSGDAFQLNNPTTTPAHPAGTARIVSSSTDVKPYRNRSYAGSTATSAAK